MEWHHRILLFAFLYSGFIYLGCFLGQYSRWPQGIWLGLMIIFGILFTILPQERRP